MRNYIFLAIILFLTSSMSVSAYEPIAEVNVYSSKPKEGLEKVFNSFTEETGIKVNLIVDIPSRLISRIKHEESGRRADILIANDLQTLENAKNEGALFPLKSAVIEENIPSQFRDEEGYWYGLSYSATIFAYAKNRVNFDHLVSYEELANKVWKDRLVIGSSNDEKTQSFFAQFIKNNGEEKATEYLRKLIHNFATPPKKDEQEKLFAVANGDADLAVTSSSSALRFINSKNPHHAKLSEEIELFVPNKGNILTQISKLNLHGAYVSVSGAAVLENSANRGQARQLLEFMSSKRGQEIIALYSYEFPVSKKAETSKSLQSLPEVHLNYGDILVGLDYHTTAMKIADEIGWK